MSDLKKIAESVYGKLECKPVAEDLENWDKCLEAIDKNTFVSWNYKPSVLRYQEASWCSTAAAAPSVSGR